jgi:hypothetical protein
MGSGPDTAESPVYPLGDIVFREKPILYSHAYLASIISHWENTVDNQLYRQTIVEMEKKNVDREYIQGWIGGFMGNPKREEQRVTEAYEQGYKDGENQNTSNYENWIVG